MAFLPTLAKEHLAAQQGDDWNYIFTILEPYQDAIEEAEDEMDILDQLTDDQHTLLIYDAMYGQVSNGGFLQLIHNGYGAFVFDPVFIEDLERWGLLETLAIVKQAFEVYTEHQELLEEERDLVAFSAFYKEFKAFESLDGAFYEIMKEEVPRFRAYIETHLASFVTLV